MSEVDALKRILRPPIDGGYRVDWAAWREEFGFDFPRDYREFMEVYGGGSIDQYLAVMPLAGDGSSWRDEYHGISRMFDADGEYFESLPYPAFPGIGGLIPWGVSAGPEFFYWHANGPNPDEWPVVVWRRADFEWYEHSQGFSSFLLAVVEGRVDDEIFNTIGFPSNRPDFLSQKGEETLANAGVKFWRYGTDPRAVVDQCLEAGINPVDFFHSAVDLM